MTEVLFYHLEPRPLEAVIPILLEKTLERGWKAVVEIGSTERAEALDAALWTFSDESFLPHALAGGEFDADQPILLTTATDNPNNAEVRFFIDRATPNNTGDYTRLVYMFDGHDPDAVTEARAVWKRLSAVHDVTYWQQEPDGKWAKKG
jgi:DNA polymerase-3 subunit chi